MKAHRRLKAPSGGSCHVDLCSFSGRLLVLAADGTMQAVRAHAEPGEALRLSWQRFGMLWRLTFSMPVPKIMDCMKILGTQCAIDTSAGAPSQGKQPPMTSTQVCAVGCPAACLIKEFRAKVLTCHERIKEAVMLREMDAGKDFALTVSS